VADIFMVEKKVSQKLQICEIQKLLDASILSGEERHNQHIENVCASDLMSDVLTQVHENMLLLTGLANPQVIRTAEMLEIPAVVFLRGKRPSEDIIRLAEECDVITLISKLSMFQACGILFSNGLCEMREQEGGNNE